MNFIFDPSLVLYLPLYQLDGASFVSRDAHGHLCSVTGALWRPNGRLVDGDDYINCGDKAVFDVGTNNITIEVWANISVLDGDYRRVISKQSAGAAFMLRKMGGGIPNRWQMVIEDGVDNLVVASLATADVNTFYHLVAVRAGVNGYLYENSILQGTSSSPTVKDYDTSGVGLYIGQRGIGTEYFKGTVGEVRIYSRALTPQEIQHNYLATKWRYR